MITKVKITQEMAGAIEKFLGYSKNDIAGLLDTHAIKNSDWVGEFEALNGLSQADLARALLIGYEVKTKFKVGDWVTFETAFKRKFTCRITGTDTVFDANLLTDYKSSNGVYQSIPKKHMKHATPEEIAEEKERRWWKSHGRDVWELRKGDVININGNLETIFKVYGNEVHTIESALIYALDLIQRSRKTKVVVFACDRKDVDHE